MMSGEERQWKAASLGARRMGAAKRRRRMKEEELRMKRYMIGFICGMSLFATVSKISAETIKMMYGNLPPHMYLDEQTGKAQGASVAYFEVVATQMGYTVEWVGPLPQFVSSTI